MADPHSASLGDIILHHVTNDLSHKYFELEVLGIDLSVTKHVLMLWIVGAFTVAAAVYGTRKYRKSIDTRPKGLGNLYEILITFIQKDIVNPNIGRKYAVTWTPLITTYFIFILTCNLFGLIPFFDYLHGGGNTVTGNFNTTIGLATITFFAIIIAGIQKHGFFGYWKSMVPGGVHWPVLIILIHIEVLSMFVRPFALTMRLGANMTAGHIGMLAIFALPILLNMIFLGAVSVALNVGLYFLEFIVSLVQAYVFTLLSAVFIGMAIHADH